MSLTQTLFLNAASSRTPDESDSHAAFQSVLASGALLSFDLSNIASVEVVQIEKMNLAKAGLDPLQAPAFSIAGQGLSLRLAANVLYELFEGHSLEDGSIHCSSNKFSGDFGYAVLDVFAPAEVFSNIEKSRIEHLCAKFCVDIIAKGNTKLDTPGVLVMDMDSTIIAMECIDEIAALAGVKDKVSMVTERAMQGEIAFTQSLYDRVACLEGVDAADLLGIRHRLPFMPSFLKTMSILKAKGWHLVLASGGFTFFADYVKTMASLDEAHSNELEIIKGKLTGKVLGRVVDGEEKARVLTQAVHSKMIDVQQSVAMGDGANDLPMMAKAGLSVAYHAKPMVSAQAHVAIRHCGFEGVLYALI